MWNQAGNGNVDQCSDQLQFNFRYSCTSKVISKHKLKFRNKLWKILGLQKSVSIKKEKPRQRLKKLIFFMESSYIAPSTIAYNDRSVTKPQGISMPSANIR